MSWSLKDVSYRMSGSGSWQHLLPDDVSRRLYADLYPAGRPTAHLLSSLPEPLFPAWLEAAFIRVAGDWVFPLGPIMTDADLEVLKEWFADTAAAMVAAIEEREEAYHRLAWEMAGKEKAPSARVDNLLTILICALTLDSRVFALLREEVIGTYPPRGRAGAFFFWGYAFRQGPQRIFGFTTYFGFSARRVHMIRSHGLDRRAVKQSLERGENREALARLWSGEGLPSSNLSPKVLRELQETGWVHRGPPLRSAVPLFTQDDLVKISGLVDGVAEKIMTSLRPAMRDFEGLWPRCSFVRCSRADVLCMLFHLAYAYATDRLTAAGMIPDFPSQAGGEWGIWVT